MTLDEFRDKNPAYKDWSDDDLANGLYKKFYSDMPREEFNTKIGYKAQWESIARTHPDIQKWWTTFGQKYPEDVKGVDVVDFMKRDKSYNYQQAIQSGAFPAYNPEAKEIHWPDRTPKGEILKSKYIDGKYNPEYASLEQPGLISRAGTFLEQGIQQAPEVAKGAMLGAAEIPAALATPPTPAESLGERGKPLVGMAIPEIVKKLYQLPQVQQFLKPITPKPGLAGEIGEFLGQMGGFALGGKALERLPEGIVPEGEPARPLMPREGKEGKIAPFGTTPDAEIMAVLEGRKPLMKWTQVEQEEFPEEYASFQEMLSGTQPKLESVSGKGGEYFFKPENRADALDRIRRLENITNEPGMNTSQDIARRTGELYGYSKKDIDYFIKRTYGEEAPKEVAPVPTTSTVGPKEFIPKMAGSTNLWRMDVDESVKKLIQQEIEKLPPNKRPFEQVRRMADYLEWTPEDVLKIPANSALTDFQGLAVRKVLVDEGVNVMNKFASDAPDRFDILKRFKDIVVKNNSFRREAGRSLGAGRIEVMGEDPVAKARNRAIDKLITSPKGEDATWLDAKMKEIAKVGSPGDMQRLVDMALRSPVSQGIDAFREGYINWLISNPATWLKVHLSQALYSMARPVERLAAAPHDALISMMRGTPRERFVAEAKVDAFAMGQAVKLGARYLLKAMQEGGLPAKPEEGNMGYYWAQSIKKERQVFTQDVLGRQAWHQPAIPSVPIPGTKLKFPLGRIVRFPGTVGIGAGDDAIKAMNWTAVGHVEAWRTAMQEGLKGDEFIKRMNYLIANPTEEMKYRMAAEAYRRSFQRPLSYIAQQVRKIRDAIPGGIGTLIDPFITIGDSALRSWYEYSPIKYLHVGGKIAYNIARNIPFDQGEAADEMGRAFFGSMVGAAAAYLAHEGYIVGRPPKQPEERQKWYAAGNKPYTFRFGNHTVGYGTIEPFGTVLGYFADVFQHQTTLDKQNLVPKLVYSLGNVMLDKGFLYGITNALDTAHDPDRYWKHFSLTLASTAVPTALAKLTRTIDPTIHKPETGLQAVEARIPGLSSRVPPMLDIWGRPVILSKPERVGQLWNPVTVAEYETDKATDEVVRLGVSIGRPKAWMGKIPLTEEEHRFLETQSGNEAHNSIMEYVTSRGYNLDSDYERARTMKRLNERANKNAREDLEDRVIDRYKKAGIGYEKLYEMKKGEEPVIQP